MKKINIKYSMPPGGITPHPAQAGHFFTRLAKKTSSYTICTVHGTAGHTQNGGIQAARRALQVLHSLFFQQKAASGQGRRHAQLPHARLPNSAPRGRRSGTFQSSDLTNRPDRCIPFRRAGLKTPAKAGQGQKV
ncbi:MAG: hypothetical protein BCS36_00880 [Desulfovibrio sp. MES5]|nr:MAG: hypothetical protein BCS36_00880 [Desulfovibrio sp. MES5]